MTPSRVTCPTPTRPPQQLPSQETRRTRQHPPHPTGHHHPPQPQPPRSMINLRYAALILAPAVRCGPRRLGDALARTGSARLVGVGGTGTPRRRPLPALALASVRPGGPARPGELLAQLFAGCGQEDGAQALGEFGLGGDQGGEPVEMAALGEFLFGVDDGLQRSLVGVQGALTGGAGRLDGLSVVLMVSPWGLLSGVDGRGDQQQPVREASTRTSLRLRVRRSMSSSYTEPAR